VNNDGCFFAPASCAGRPCVVGSLESAAADSWQEMNESGSLWLEARWVAGSVAVIVDSHNDIEP
jgi:hypothetical protein